jgi:hypothetical protein
MSVRVVCYRKPCTVSPDGTPGPDCRPADPVSSPLISTPEVARARGTAILDSEGQDWQPLTAEIPADANMAPGQLIKKVDHEGSYKAQLEAVTYTVKIGDKSFTADASLALRRPADNE